MTSATGDVRGLIIIDGVARQHAKPIKSLLYVRGGTSGPIRMFTGCDGTFSVEIPQE